MQKYAFKEIHRLIESRRSIRNFEKGAIPREILNSILDCARWAPSGYNLQPTHFFVVTDKAIKKDLYHAAYGQRQVLDAPCTVVFIGDMDVAKNHFERVLAQDLASGAIDHNYIEHLRKIIPMAFGRGPLNLLVPFKKVFFSLLRAFKVIPNLPAEDMRLWVSKQVMLSAMNYLIAVKAAGLGACPMEGFDADKVQKILGIPKSFVVALIVPTGYAAQQPAVKSRVPLEDLIHNNKW